MDDVMPFLENVTRERGVPHERLLEVAHHYELFGGVSPISAQNRALISVLEVELRAHGIELPVYFGNRNWHPFLTDTLRQMRDDGVRRALALFTSAFSSYSGCRQYREDLFRAQQAVGADAPEVPRARMFFNHP
ncbi:MAG: ferrochelatase, partial [Gaiellaceae bacterium]